MFVGQIESIRALAKKVTNDVDLQHELDLDSISAAQLSRRLKEMSSDFWGTVFTRAAQITMQKTTNNHLSAIPYADRVHIIDASTSELTPIK